MKTISLLFVFALGLHPHPVAVPSLNARYHFVQMAIVGSETGQPVETQTAGGDIIFDGAGAYRLSAHRRVGADAAESYDAIGVYSVSASGVVVMTDPANAQMNLNARLGADGTVLIGSSTDAGDGTRDLFIGVRAAEWQDGHPESHLNGSYAGASFSLPDGLIDGLTTAFVELNADGGGSFSAVVATGQSSNQKNLTVRQKIADTGYTLRSDGGGRASFGDSATLFGGSREIFVSPDGEILIGFSPDAGRREILVAVRRAAITSIAGWDGSWWINELLADNEIAGAVRLSSSVGTLEPDGAGAVRLSQRINTGEPWRDVTAVNYAALGPDGSAQLGPILEDGRSSLTIGSTAFVNGEVGAAGSTHRMHGLLFGVRAPSAQVFDVRNAASLAIAPISAGGLITLRGSGLASATANAPEGEPAYELGGVRVVINTNASELFSVSPGQINLQAPLALSGDVAVVTVQNGDALSRPVKVPLSPTSPGIFSQDGTGAGSAAVSHADGTLVSVQSPATPGETITILATGLGSASGMGNLLAYVGKSQCTVTSADPLAAMTGVSRVRVVLPAVAPSGKAIPLALGAAAAFTAMVDIAIR